MSPPSPSSTRIYDENKLNRYEDFLLQEGTTSAGDESLSEGMRAKIKSEIVSPFRRFRQFVLFGTLAAAGLGSFTSVPQLIIGINKPEGGALDVLYQNVGVNLLGLLGATYFLYKDFTCKK